jgi:hypothetical protein
MKMGVRLPRGRMAAKQAISKLPQPHSGRVKPRIANAGLPLANTQSCMERSL